MIDTTALRGISLFQGLTDDQLRTVLSVVQARRIRPGTVVLREGDHSDSLFILASGSVEVTKRLGLVTTGSPDEVREKMLVRLSAPHFFGEMGLIEATERSASVTAHRDCELLELRRADFERLVETDTQLGFLLVRNIAIAIASRLRQTDRDILKLTVALSLALGNR